MQQARFWVLGVQWDRDGECQGGTFGMLNRLVRKGLPEKASFKEGSGERML